MPPKQDDKKPPEPSNKDPFVEAVFFLLGIFLLVYIVNGVVHLVTANKYVDSVNKRGFNAEAIYLVNTSPLNLLENPVGARTINQNDTSVYDAPEGKEIGTQPILAKGAVIQGPVYLHETNEFWYIDYDTGSDGWVKDQDILYFEREPNLFERTLYYIFKSVWYLAALLVIFNVLGIVFVFYLYNKLDKLRADERKMLYPEGIGKVSELETDKNPYWEKILKDIDSRNPSDWRLAIIEADVMLDGLLNKMSIPGNSIAEKLKSVERSDFTTLDYAWEAHKVRNEIAHSGSTYQLSQREARRVISLYKAVFEEFKII